MSFLVDSYRVECENQYKTNVFLRWFLYCSQRSKCFLVGFYAFLYTTNVFGWFLCFCTIKPMLSCWFLCFVIIKPLLCLWFLWFSKNKQQCFLVGSYAFHYEANVFLVCSYVFWHTKPMLFRWFLCFSLSNSCFFVGSYALHITTNAFLLVPMLCIIKPMLLCCFLCCFSQ